LSVPSGFDQSASGKPMGGLKLSISESEATSIGSCGAIHEANTAAMIMTSATAAEAIAIGDRRKL
jgi:hypothetical protein